MYIILTVIEASVTCKILNVKVGNIEAVIDFKVFVGTLEIESTQLSFRAMVRLKIRWSGVESLSGVK